MSYPVEINHVIEVSDESITQLIESAGYGIGYWASAAVVDTEAQTYTVTESEDGTEHVIPFSLLATTLVEVAIGLHAVGYSREYAQQWLGNDQDAGIIDSDLADVIVQIAALGEIVYG